MDGTGREDSFDEGEVVKEEVSCEEETGDGVNGLELGTLPDDRHIGVVVVAVGEGVVQYEDEREDIGSAGVWEIIPLDDDDDDDVTVGVVVNDGGGATADGECDIDGNVVIIARLSSTGTLVDSKSAVDGEF